VNEKDRILHRLDELVEESDRLAGTHRPVQDNMHNRILDGYVERGGFAAWHTSSLSLVGALVGPNSQYLIQLRSFDSDYLPTFQRAQAIVRRVRDDYAKGYLKDLRELAAAEVFTDFLDMADHLHANGYCIAAASIAGAVLEDGLRRLHVKHIGPWEGDSSIAKLNDGLRKAGVYAQAMWRQIQAWGDIRNDGDHGHFDKVDAGQVKLMVSGVRDFIARHEG
jgi:hypothetical protein